MVQKFWHFVRGMLFQWDAETVHHWVSRGLIFFSTFAPFLLRWISKNRSTPSSPRSLWGLSFQNRVGMAAGFDKNGELMEAFYHLGFGFIEIGAVTPRPQTGNPRPRLFRNAKEEWIFNRMGFNNEGCEKISQRVRLFRKKTAGRHDSYRIGVNLGKNKDTPTEKAADDYVEVARAFKEIADFLVINVSSPNTPGLRDLQNASELVQIVKKVHQEVSSGTQNCPILVKLAPEVDGMQLRELVPLLEDAGVSGWVLTNTLKSEFEYSPGQKYMGGMSGRCLSDLSRQRLKELRPLTQRPIISVGGIVSTQEARVRFELGADLIQVYSGFIFEGPTFVAMLVEETSDV